MQPFLFPLAPLARPYGPPHYADACLATQTLYIAICAMGPMWGLEDFQLLYRTASGWITHLLQKLF